jgi:hypothetical protein
MSTADPTAYGWLHEDLAWFGTAACVTVAAGVTREQFVNAFGVDLASPQSRENSRGPSDDEDAPALISFTEVAGCLVAVEVDGLTGSETDVLEATSIRGRAASAFWNADDHVRFACARDGEVLYDGELVHHGDDEDTDRLPAELAPILGGARQDEGLSLQAVAMALVEAWTNARVKAADIERALTLGYIAES